MPELAEVEYYRKQMGSTGSAEGIVAVNCMHEKRIFRGSNTRELRTEFDRRAPAAIDRARQADALRVFRRQLARPSSWDERNVARRGGCFDRRSTIIWFSDKRNGSRLSRSTPVRTGSISSRQRSAEWWSDSTLNRLERSSPRVRRGIPATPRPRADQGGLLLQCGFPGIGNWMADEILWRAKFAPAKRGAHDAKERIAPCVARHSFVSRESLRIIGHDNSDLPESWLIHQRWKATASVRAMEHRSAARRSAAARPHGARSVSPDSSARMQTDDLVEAGRA